MHDTCSKEMKMQLAADTRRAAYQIKHKASYKEEIIWDTYRKSTSYIFEKSFTDATDSDDFLADPLSFNRVG